MRKQLAGLAGALGMTALALTGTTAPAQACGGFFCSQLPVDQMGEQIIFGMEDGTITAQILINYTGEAEDFAWILPVASKPEISLGTLAAFQAVTNRTQPSFNLQWLNQDTCGGWRWFAPESAVDDADGRPNAGGGVNVLEQREVGPFTTATLESSSTSELVDWLNTNGFDQPEGSIPLIQHYVDQNMIFVAVKLSEGEAVGSIQPLTLKFQEANPCVPLVLTQIAAVPDMPVQLFLLGEHRVVPTNWMHVVINQKKIDWLNFGSNYGDVVTQAIDEAAGHGFVTEYAGTSSILADALYREGQFDLAALSQISSPSALLDALLQQGLPRDSQMQGLLRKYIPMPAHLAADGLTERDFYNNIEAYEDELGEDYVLDITGFVAELEERIVAPMRATQELFDRHPYLTRLYTTVSPDEMTRDPIFATNPDMGNVSNQHTAMAEAICSGDDGDIEKIVIELETGEIFEIEGPFDDLGWWGGGEWVDPAPDEPAAKRIELLGRTGGATIVAPSQVAQVDKALDQKSTDDVIKDMESGVIAPPVNPPTTFPTSGESSGCQGGGPGAPLWFGVLALVGLALVARRRRTMI